MIDIERDKVTKFTKITIKGSIMVEQVRKVSAATQDLLRKGVTKILLDATKAIPSQRIMNLWRVLENVNKKLTSGGQAHLLIREDSYDYCVKSLGYSELVKFRQPGISKLFIQTVGLTEQEVLASLKQRYLDEQEKELLPSEEQIPEERGFSSYIIDVLDVRPHSILASFHDLMDKEHELIMNRKPFVVESADFRGAKVALLIKYSDNAPVGAKLELLNKQQRPHEKLSDSEKSKITEFFQTVQKEMKAEMEGNL